MSNDPRGDRRTIALVTSSYAPYVGGVEEHVRNVAKVLTDRGHHVVVWTIARDGGFEVREVDGIEVWDLPAPLPSRSLGGVLRFLLRVPRAALLWLRAARRLRPDVLHVHCFGPNGSYALPLSRLLRLPLVVSSHGETLADDAGVFDSSALARSSLRASLGRAAAVTGCSQVTLDDLQERFGLAPGAGDVVFNGVDLDEPAGPLPDGVPSRYVAAVGRVQALKGFDLLLEAFAQARLPKDVGLVIGGDGPEREHLQQRARELGIADRVRLPGTLARPQVVSLRSQALVNVVPSRLEPFGIAVLEGWRSGTPVIATTHGGPSEFVRDGVDGLLRDPLDTDALAAALETLIVNDPAAGRAIGAAGARRVRDFTWEGVVDEYEEILNRLEPRPSR